MSKVVSGEPAGRPKATEPADAGVTECCRYTWLSALTLAENVLLDDVYERVQARSPHDAVRECVLALRLLKEMGRPWCSRED